VEFRSLSGNFQEKSDAVSPRSFGSRRNTSAGLDRECFPRLTERLFCLTKTLTIRGLRWDQRSPHICWRDERGRQHQQSTQTDDPAKALAFKQTFQKENREAIQERRARTADQGRLPLGEAAKMYFNWKAATNRDGTIAREKRIFRQIAFGNLLWPTSAV
jgi:hypothetical protein